MLAFSRQLIQNKYLSRLFSDATLTKKAYLNVLAVLIDYAARLLIGFLVTPLLVAGLGSYAYGIWQIISRLTDYLLAATGRPTQALKWTIANLQSSDDLAQKRRNVGNAVAVWFLYLPILLGLGSVFVWYLPYWFGVKPGLVKVAQIATWILVFKMTLTSLVMIPESILQGENCAYKRIGMTAIMVFVGGGLTILALHLNTGLPGVAIATTVTSILTGLTYLTIAHRFVPWLGIEQPRLNELKQFFTLSGWFLVWRLVITMMTASDIILLGAFVSVESVTGYSLTKYVPETLVALLGSIVFGMSPGVGGILGAGDLRRVAALRSEIYVFVWFAATLIGSLVLLWNDSFLGLWVGAGHFTGAGANLLIIIMMIQFVLIRVESSFIDLTLELKLKVIIGILSVLLSIGLALLLISFAGMGIGGLCFGFIVGRLILSIGYPIMIGRYLEIPMGTQFKAIRRPLSATIVVLSFTSMPGLLGALHYWFQVNNWLDLAIGMALSCFSMTLVILIAGLSRSQLQQFVVRLRHAIT